MVRLLKFSECISFCVKYKEKLDQFNTVINCEEVLFEVSFCNLFFTSFRHILETIFIRMCTSHNCELGNVNNIKVLVGL